MAGARFIWVHGMGEKPEPERERQEAWEALQSNLWIRIPYEAFEVAYWADLRRPPEGGAPGARPSGELLRVLPARHRAALDFAFVTDLVDSNREARFQDTLLVVPQRAGLLRTARSLRDYVGRPHLLAFNAAEATGNMLQMLRRRVSWRTQRRTLQAIMYLYRDAQPYLEGITRWQIIDRVIERLRAAKGGPICVISQSMGTIVALDAIYHWTEGEVETLITLGSPLGIQFFREKLWGQPAFPPNVRRWYNFYDQMDNVAVWDRQLRDDFPTTNGERKITDQQARDNYNKHGFRDPHDWYGYLSSPELADVVCHFWLGANGAAAPAG
ncbi:MAG: hypothetical protein A2148_11815 [Chloroflexi bacterium RBG_16_68_14]|nr:MAG: hypothetical protein A2148_11815 [Chloroflexi bacterium RBG_16_68_14]